MTIAKARQILGKDGDKFTDGEIKARLNAVHSLALVFFSQLERERGFKLTKYNLQTTTECGLNDNGTHAQEFLGGRRFQQNSC